MKIFKYTIRPLVCVYFSLSQYFDLLDDPEKTKFNLNLDFESSFLSLFLLTNDIQIGLQKLTIACKESHRTRQLKICPPNMSESKVSCLFNYVQ